MSILEAIVGPVSKLLDKIIPDPQARDKAKLELLKLQGDQEMQTIAAQMQAIVAEAQSNDPWTSRARPSFLYMMYALILWCDSDGPDRRRRSEDGAGHRRGNDRPICAEFRRSSTPSSAPATSATRRRGPGVRSRARRNKQRGSISRSS